MSVVVVVVDQTAGVFWSVERDNTQSPLRFSFNSSYLVQGRLSGAALGAGVARTALEDRDEVVHPR